MVVLEFKTTKHWVNYVQGVYTACVKSVDYYRIFVNVLFIYIEYSLPKYTTALIFYSKT